MIGKKTLIRGAAALLLAGASTASAVAPSFADVDRNCYGGEFCAYQDANFDMSRPVYRFSAADEWWWYGQREVSNADSSWQNLWSVAVRVYDGPSYTGGATICVRSGQLIGYDASANDRGESHKYNGQAGC